jgi:hypothetical protein
MDYFPQIHWPIPLGIGGRFNEPHVDAHLRAVGREAGASLPRLPAARVHAFAVDWSART